MTTPALPKDHELLTPEFLRKYGAQKGMMLCEEGIWEPVDYVPTGFKALNFEYRYSAPLGTTAAATTPVRGGKCECEKEILGYHLSDCPKNPRNRRVHIMPWELAGLDEEPEGLEWAKAGKTDSWQKCVLIWPPPYCRQEALFCTAGVAYSVPLHVYERIQAGTREICRVCGEYIHQCQCIPAVPPLTSASDGETLLDWADVHIESLRITKDGTVEIRCVLEPLMAPVKFYTGLTLREAIRNAIKGGK